MKLIVAIYSFDEPTQGSDPQKMAYSFWIYGLYTN